MTTFPFELVAPERVLFSGEVDAVILPATEGEMTVLPGHAPTLTALKTGFLVLTDHQGHGQRVLVRGGFADIGPSGLTVLAERAVPLQELTPEIIDREILQAELAIDTAKDQASREAAENAITQLREARVALNY